LALWSVRSGPFLNNSYLLLDAATGKSALFDPFFDSAERFAPVLESLQAPFDTILLTHAHIDHVGGVASLLRRYPEARVLAHEAGVPLMSAENVAALTGGVADLDEYAKQFSLPRYEPVRPTDFLQPGEPVFVGETRFEVLHTPGHCPGHVAFLNREMLLSGDVLYKGSVGFTTIPLSDADELAESIVRELLPLDDDVTVFTGHSSFTTIGAERTSNPFILEALRARR